MNRSRWSSPPRVGRNVTAGLIGNAWVALMGIAFLPVFFRYLGAESYGLIGVFLLIQAAISVLDLGLTAIFTREVARLRTTPDGPARLSDLLRTLEWLYWGMAAALGLAIALGGPTVIRLWLSPSGLSPATVDRAISLIGITLAMRWPLPLYVGGLAGLERQVMLNAHRIVVETFRNVGAAVVLAIGFASIESFFLWQIIVTTLGTLSACYLLRSVLPEQRRQSRFDAALLRAVFPMAMGLTGISVTALVLTQLDKFIVGRLLSLESFGYYSFASTVAMGLLALASPVFQAYYPRMTTALASRDRPHLVESYHEAAQAICVLVGPAAICLSVFAPEILLLWTRNDTLATAAAPVLAVLAIGTLCNGIMTIPYGLQLAAGTTRLALCSNAIAIVVIVPALVFAIGRGDLVGAAWAWCVLNIGYVALQAPLVHYRLLSGEHKNWLCSDTLKPLLLATMVTLACRYVLLGAQASSYVVALVIGVALLTSYGASLLAAPAIRGKFVTFIRS